MNPVPKRTSQKRTGDDTASSKTQDTSMKRLASTAIVPAIAAALLSACATPEPYTGPTLADVMAKQARKAGRADIDAVLGKKLPPSITPNGMKADMMYKSDGSFEGTLQVLRGPNAGASTRSNGKWTMDDSGRFCMTENLVDWNKVVSKCMDVYVAGNELWVTNEGAARGEPASLFATRGQ